MLLDPHALKIYIDGSCLKNPGGRGGFAAIVVYPDDWNRPDEQLLRQGFTETTNNRMELRAYIEALKHIRDCGAALGVQRVQIVTDSKYVYENEKRAENWKRKDWRNTAGKPVENHLLWKELLSVRAKVRVRTNLMWMKGKKTPILKDVDKAAKAAASEPWNIDRGFRAGKVGRSKVRKRAASNMFPATGQQAIIHVYHTGVMVDGENKIHFDFFNEEKREFTNRFHAYAAPEIAFQLHRGHCYRVTFNDDSSYPRVQSILGEVTTNEIASVVSAAKT